jgi:hypothetical protein
MNLYSLNSQRPAPLPFRIKLPNGFTRTDPSTFSFEEIATAGFIGPYVEPFYDPSIERLDWVNGNYVISALPPPPQPELWVEFGEALSADVIVNQFVSSLSQEAPVLHLMIGVGLGKAAEGDSVTFLTAWSMGMSLGLIPLELATHVANLATEYNLPEYFILALTGETPIEL